MDPTIPKLRFAPMLMSTQLVLEVSGSETYLYYGVQREKQLYCNRDNAIRNPWTWQIKNWQTK